TLFLDEIGDMSPAMQAALLRALEQREVVRVGDTVPRRVDFRLVSATHRDVPAEVREGRFRQDLSFRVAEMTLTIPPLAARGSDVILLAELFLRETERDLGIGPRRIAPAAERALSAHDWPGNVRELKNAVTRTLFHGTALGQAPPSLPGPLVTAKVDLSVPLKDAREQLCEAFEEAYLREALSE
ncbi:MAG: sigma-54-dependent Fis family transcriptional regulator, partial [Gemmatimonadetes bacterium]|nr:sigma-54-dependent Fis family transcriptional regulator [Gemmatimonadota bacterium]